MKKWVIGSAILTSVLIIALIVNINVGLDAPRSISEIGNTVTITIGADQAYAAGTPDQTCDGTDDNAQFTTAIAALPAGGGKISVLAGTYNWANATSVNVPANVTIEGVGLATYFNGDGATALFIATGNNTVFSNLRTDPAGVASGITMGATTGWQWNNVNNGLIYYAYRSTSGQSIFNDVTAASVTDSGLTSGRVLVASTGGLLADDSGLTYNIGTDTLSTGAVTATGALTGASIVAPTGVGAGKVVAGVDAPQAIKDRADYTCDGTDDDVQLLAAVNSLTAGRTWKESVVGYGTFTLSHTVVVPSYTILDLSKAKLATKSGGTTEHSLVSSTDANYVDVTIGNIDIGWTDGSAIGVLWDGVSWSTLDITGCKINRLFEMRATNNGCKRNVIKRVMSGYGNPVTSGIKLIGAPGKEITLNQFQIINIVLPGSGTGTAIDFAKYVDNNDFIQAYAYLGYAGQSGVVYNSDTPLSDMEVYENHFWDLTVDHPVTGTNSLVENVCTPNYPSYVKLRLGNSYPTYPSLKSPSNIRLSHLNMNGKLSENSGTATVANATTTIKVTHGLAAVPTRIQLTATAWGNSAKAWISSKDSDGDGLKFTITVDADPGATGATFDWKAVIGEGS
jgi:hypothetical protein